MSLRLEPKKLAALFGVVAVSLILLVTSDLVSQTIYAEAIYPNVFYDGMDLGGKTRAEAELLIRQKENEILAKHLVFSAGDEAIIVMARDTGLAVDASRIAENCFSINRDRAIHIRWFDQIRTMAMSDSARRQIEPMLSFDQDKFNAFAAKLRERFENLPQDASFKVVDNRVEVTKEAPGLMILQSDLQQRILSTVQQNKGYVIDLETVEILPSVTEANLATGIAKAQSEIDKSSAVASKKAEEKLIVDETKAELEKRLVTFGRSLRNRQIDGYIFGEGRETILLFGAIHGYKERGTALLMNKLAEELAKNPAAVGQSKRVIILPVLNPDGLQEKNGKLNANDINLNLNFATTDWKSDLGSPNLYGGEEAFSEPESRVLRDLVATYGVDKMISYHARGGFVCPEYGHVASQDFAKLYSKLSGYSYDNDISWFFPGTATRWFAETVGGSAITVELPTYTSMDWASNKRAIYELIK